MRVLLINRFVLFGCVYRWVENGQLYSYSVYRSMTKSRIVEARWNRGIQPVRGKTLRGWLDIVDWGGGVFRAQKIIKRHLSRVEGRAKRMRLDAIEKWLENENCRTISRGRNEWSGLHEAFARYRPSINLILDEGMQCPDFGSKTFSLSLAYPIRVFRTNLGVLKRIEPTLWGPFSDYFAEKWNILASGRWF